MSTWIKKALLILLLLLFTAAAGSYFYLSTAGFRNFAREKATEWFAGRFRGRLQIEQLEWSPFSNTVTVKGLRIDAPDSSDNQPAITARQAVVKFSLGSFFSPQFDLTEVLLDGLQVRVLREPDDRINLARTFERPGQQEQDSDQENQPEPDIQPLLRLAIDRIQARDSVIHYFDQPLALDTLEGNLQFELALRTAENAYRGQLQMKSMEFGIAGITLPALDLQAQFILEQTRIRLDRLSMEAPWIKGNISGLVDGYVTLDHQMSVDLELDTAALSAAFALDTPLQGRVSVIGTARGRKGAYGLAGEVRGDALRVAQIGVNSPQAEFRLDNDGVDLNRFSGVFEGIPFQGRGQLWWKSDRTSTIQATSSSLHRHPLARLVEPYARLLAGGQALGNIHFPGLSFSEWQGSGTARLPGQLGQRPGVEVGPAFLLESAWSGDSKGIQFSSCSIELEETQISCVGELAAMDRYSFEVEYQAESTSSAFAWGKTWIPFPGPDVQGQISGRGALSSQPGQPFLWHSETHLDDLILQETSLGPVTIDVNRELDGSWKTNLEFSDQGPIQGRIAAVLDQEEMPIRSVEADLQGDLSPLLEQELDWPESRAPAQIEASLTREEGELGGSASLQGKDWMLFGQALQSVAGDIEMRGKKVTIREFQARLPDRGRLVASGEIDLSTRSHLLTFEGRELDLSRLAFVPQTSELRGLAEVSGSSSGSQWPPNLSAQLQVNQLQISEMALGDLAVRVEYRTPAPQAEVSGSLSFQDQEFPFRGEIGLSDPYPYNLLAQLPDLPPAQILASFMPDKMDQLPELGGSIRGEVTVSGQLAGSKVERAEARLDQLSIQVADLELRNQKPLVIGWQEDRVTLQLVTFEGSGSSFTLQGNMRIADDPGLNVRAQGTARLDLLNPFLEGASLEGPAEVQLILVGTLSEPRLVGEVDLVNASIAHPSLPERLTAVNSRLRFTAEQIAVEEFRATTRYGTFEAEGGIFLDGFSPSRWFLNITGQDLHLEYPDSVFTVADVDLDLSKGEGTALLSGIVNVRSSTYQEQLSLSDLLLRYSQMNSLQAGSTSTDTLDLNITLNAYRAIRIENNLADIYASGDLQIRGTSANPVLQGSLVVDQGRLFLERNEYRLIRGGVNFNDPRRTRPSLNFEAETEVQDYTIGIQVSGPVDRMNINFRSDPPLPTPNIVSLLALGQIGVFEGGGQQRAESLAVYGAGALLNQSLSQRLGSQGSRLFGLDRITIDPFLASSERNPGARVTLGKHLGNRLSVTYSTDLGSESQGQIVVIQWKLTDWLTVVGTGEQNGALALDFKLRRRF